MVAASTTVASDRSRSPASAGAVSRRASSGSPARVGELELAANRDHPASHVPHVARERALGEGESSTAKTAASTVTPRTWPATAA